ncbi:hypothetical protein SY85_10760 [Flavisolibacter tropicus]|uniref:Uncharacterized protein n=1 Tax=Flavisolibacter tropicus TaxID=1492898 RepID=A0A172TV87_9BACT|nr:hypothetical protein SY85_10760 [Flavisolibacter tropicus]
MERSTKVPFFPLFNGFYAAEPFTISTKPKPTLTFRRASGSSFGQVHTQKRRNTSIPAFEIVLTLNKYYLGFKV